ncbi:MAG TPA: periplasmic heavy metal sensor [Caulobacterales bacterium]|nr:periplasmic heavy metal sensor [Caulobacterales bacterium]
MNSVPWRTLLFVSVALNLLLIGLGAGMFLGGAGRDAAPISAEGRVLAPRAILAALPDDARRPLRRTMVQAWRASAEERAGLRQANAEVLRLLRADAYDAAAMRAALERQRAAAGASTAVFHDAAADAFAALTPAQRRTVADALVAPRQRIGERLRQLSGEDR